MIYLVVSMEIVEGKMDEFLAACKQLRPQVLAEKGCLMYDYALDIDTAFPVQEPIVENRVTLLEKWESREDLDLHMASEHMAEYLQTVASMRKSVVIRGVTEAF